MHGNICPCCGNGVMPYSRFLREAEPNKISRCSSCSAELKRSPRVYLHVGTMSLLLAVIGTPLFVSLLETQFPAFILWGTIMALLTFWVLLTNYFSWRWIGWVMAGKKIP